MLGVLTAYSPGVAEKTDIASYLARRREESGLSRPAVSRRTGVPVIVSAAYLKDVEDARRSPSAKVLRALALVYGDDPALYLRLAGYLSDNDADLWSTLVGAVRGDPNLPNEADRDGVLLAMKQHVKPLIDKAAKKKVRRATHAV